MKHRKLSSMGKILILAFIIPNCTISLFAQTLSVTTQRYDNHRLGLNNKEPTLNSNNVNSGNFGLLFTRMVDDQIYAQPLIVTGLTINDSTHNVVFVATVNNSVYAFDADRPTENDPLWMVNLTPSGSRVITNTDYSNLGACDGNYKDFSGNIGIVGTPVIDSTTSTLFVVSRDIIISSGLYEQYFHALDFKTGKEKPGSPVLINATYKGTGMGSDNGTITFNPQSQNQRSALMLYNNIVYICWASYCDWGEYHGWMIGYDAGTYEQKIVYNITPDGYYGGLWMSGAGPVTDDNGYIYITSGNGSVGTDAGPNDPRNRGESLLKLQPSGDSMRVVDFFTPNNYNYLEINDLDFGTNSVVILPNSTFAISGSKEGKLYFLDINHLGKYTADNDSVIQVLYTNPQNVPDMHIHGTPVYYHYTDVKDKECLYVWAESDSMKQFFFDRNSGKFDLSQTITGKTKLDYGMPGSMLMVSSDGTKNETGIVWASHPLSGDANHSVRPGILEAYDARDVRKLLWSSQQRSSRDAVGYFAKFNNPVVANGKVYLATFSNKLDIYGLLPVDSSTNLALNKPAIASSLEANDLVAENANDGDTTTRWSSERSDPQWITIDLLKLYDINKVVLRWEAASAKSYILEVSDDSISWRTAKEVTNGIGGVETDSLNGAYGRFIRLKGLSRNTVYGYSLYEFEVYGNLRNATLIPHDNEKAPEIIIYPNPVQDEITATFNKNQFTQAAITDITGKIIIQSEILPGQTQFTLNVSSLNKGIYLLTLRGDSEKAVRKIIKQ